MRTYVYESPITFLEYYLKTYKRFYYNNKIYDAIFVDGNGEADTFFRSPVNVNSTRPPVLIMGCSFAY